MFLLNILACSLLPLTYSAAIKPMLNSSLDHKMVAAYLSMNPMIW